MLHKVSTVMPISELKQNQAGFSNIRMYNTNKMGVKTESLEPEYDFAWFA
jgi:hypothetical protein